MAEVRRVVETKLPRDEAYKKCFNRAGQFGLDIRANIPSERLEFGKTKRIAGWWAAVIIGFCLYIAPGALVMIFWKAGGSCTLVFVDDGAGTNVTAQVQGRGEGGIGFFNEVSGSSFDWAAAAQTRSKDRVAIARSDRTASPELMSDREFLEVDPAMFRVPPSRRSGADPYNLQRQVARHGTSIGGMPPIEVSRGADGELVINNGVTRATRAARYVLGTSVPVEVIDTLPISGAQFPTIGDLL